MQRLIGSGAGRGGPFSTLRVDGVMEALMFGWIGLMVVGVVRDQIALLPPRPPTPAEVAAATPGAQADWNVVYARLSRRLPYPPPEVGAVWATRSGRICGLVDNREAAVDDMVEFYTVGLVPRLRRDDPRGFMREWLECLDVPWVELRAGTRETGFCASRRGRSSWIGRSICQGR